MVNETAHIHVPGNNVGPTGGAPTVVLSVREKQMGTSIQRRPPIYKAAAPKTTPILANDVVVQ